MLVYHLTKNGGYHRWAFVPFDDSHTPFLRDGDSWRFVWPACHASPTPVGPADMTEEMTREVSSFVLYRFTLKHPPNFYPQANWAIRADDVAAKLIECEHVASFPYARTLNYG